MQGISDMTDYFVVCHGNNERQVQSIARAVKEAVHEQGIDVKRMEGYNDARWVLIDLANVVVHIFHKDERNIIISRNYIKMLRMSHMVRLLIKI